MVMGYVCYGKMILQEEVIGGDCFHECVGGVRVLLAMAGCDVYINAAGFFVSMCRAGFVKTSWGGVWGMELREEV